MTFTAKLDAFHRATLSVHSATSVDDLTHRLLGTLFDVVPGEACLVNWFGLPSRPVVTFYEPAELTNSEINRLAHLFLHQHPSYGRRHDRAGSISDYMSRRDWHRTDMYAQTYGKLGLEDGLGLDLDLGAGCTLTMEVIRARRGFSEVDRRMMNNFRQHIGLAYQRLVPLSVGSNLPGQSLAAATLRVDAAGRARQFPAAARQILQRYFELSSGDFLPRGLMPWFQHTTGSLREPAVSRPPMLTQRLGRPGRVLAIHCAVDANEPGGYVVTLEETYYGDTAFGRVRLSPREREMLRWAARGQSNSEIAAQTNISAGTVKRHLENLYRKLGVNTRQAAVTLARQTGTID